MINWSVEEISTSGLIFHVYLQCLLQVVIIEKQNLCLDKVYPDITL